MSPPDKLVIAAAEAICTEPSDGKPCVLCVREATLALAAAFRALPVEELRAQAREAVRHLHVVGTDRYDECSLCDSKAAAASDVWLAALARMVDE